MSEHTMVMDMLESVLDDRVRRLGATRAVGHDDGLWTLLEETGLTRYALSAASDGYDATLAQQHDVLAAVAARGLLVALGETWVAGRLLELCGRPVPAGPVDIAFAARCGDRSARLGGRAGDWAPRVLAVESTGSLARARLIERAVPATADWFEVDPAVAAVVELRRALNVASSLTGAMSGAFELARAYAAQRRQFGRPIARFQAVQDLLARAAAEVAAASAVTRMAASLEEGSPFALAVALARARSAKAARAVAASCHQIHGAIGITEEHALHRLTRQLWSLRGEGGGERAWAQRAGRLLLEEARLVEGAGGTGVWEVVEGLSPERHGGADDAAIH